MENEWAPEKVKSTKSINATRGRSDCLRSFKFRDTFHKTVRCIKGYTAQASRFQKLEIIKAAQMGSFPSKVSFGNLGYEDDRSQNNS